MAPLLLSLSPCRKFDWWKKKMASMDLSMDYKDWLLFGGQLLDQFGDLSQTVDLFDPLLEGSNAAEYSLFNDAAASKSLSAHDEFMDTLDSGCTTLEFTGNASSKPDPCIYGVPNGNCDTTGYLLQKPSSPWPSLPSSPEIYGDLGSIMAGHEVEAQVLPGSPEILAAHCITPDQSLIFSEPSAENSEALCDDCKIAPDCLEPQLDEMDVLFALAKMTRSSMIEQAEIDSIGPNLPQVSLDDVESLLSSSVSSCAASDVEPQSTSLLDVVHVRTFADPSGTVLPVLPDPGFAVSETPCELYTTDVTVLSGSEQPEVRRDRKQRKKEQNKTAAQRYREKKRSEKGSVISEYEQLERRNIELHTKVNEMTKEIAYLKGLIEEICS